MSKSHNKKRNSGLLYEFLVTVISKSLITGDKRASSQALKIIKRHFKPGTELYKEFRLINALRKTTISSQQVAVGILHEAKSAARTHNVKELDRQKSLLIRDINHMLKDDDFYDQQVSEYKILATVQTLLNDWRTKDADLSRVAQYEDLVLQHLLAEKTDADQTIVTENNEPGEARLLMKIMTKKLNEKYAGVLNDSQRSLIKSYAFSTANNDLSTIVTKLTEIRDGLSKSIDEFIKNNPTNEYVSSKLSKERDHLLAETFDVVNDETVVKFMLYAKLEDELNNGGENV